MRDSKRERERERERERKKERERGGEKNNECNLLSGDSGQYMVNRFQSLAYS